MLKLGLQRLILLEEQVVVRVLQHGLVLNLASVLLNTLLCTQLELSILFLDLLELRLEVDDRVQLLLEMLLE